MDNKALTIDVNSSAIPSGELDNWSPLGDISVFIKNIITPDINKKTNIGQLVSGIPTAFARVDLFKTALDHLSANSDSATANNLIGYYSKLVDEWKGLIACMALDYAHISVRRIDLTYSDGNDIDKTANVYEPKGAFGNMLLRRRNRWCDQNLTSNQTAVPYINVIKYRNQVVGATAPECLLFTSTGYACEASVDLPWVDVQTGKFTDPLNSPMSPLQIAQLHAYISHILSGLDAVGVYYSNLPDGEGVDYTSIRTVLESWKEEVENRAEENGVELSIGSTPPVSAAFGGPFEKLFCYKDILFGLEGVVSDRSNGGVEFDPQNLLLDDTAHIAKLDLNITPQELKQLPILVMTADVKGMGSSTAYFALPLSAQGLNVFGKNIAALVGMSNSATAIASSLKATYDPALRNDNLEVVLTLITDTGIRRSFKKVYTSDGEVKNNDILIWPNFISPQWDAYYMYNEMPHNGNGSTYQAYPFVGDVDQGGYFRILVDDNQRPILLSEKGRIIAPDNIVKSELLVLSDETVADNPYKYEIYRSNKPFKGVRLLSTTGNEGGYLLINYSSAQDTNLPHDWMLPGAHAINQSVRLGIDFGSTNTSIAYSSDNTQERGFEFSSQRVSLMGNELPGKPVFPRENQVLFFQGPGPAVMSNAIKSVLTIHDNRRLPALQMGQTIRQRNEREVVGGFPCFAENLPFVNSDKNSITLSYPNGIGQVTQIHNMKWEDTPEDKAHKSAFLRTLMLQVYATLFAQGYVPDSVKWSYPSAMGGQLMLSYQTIWSSLSEVTPVLDNSGNRYPLSVSQYINTRTLNTPLAPVSPNNGASNDGGGFGNQNQTQSNPFSGGFGGSFGGGFGSGAGFGGGFGGSKGSEEPVAAPQKDTQEGFMPDDPNSEIQYQPKPLYTTNNANANPSLSEAEAVANFVSVKYGTQANVLNLCFDVGGSTTDISALFYLSNDITMIKQNSLRFAAQRVSQSVAQFPEFKTVLSGICSKYNIKIVGLNYGNNTYNSSTAPYFFDQIVNKLNDSQLGELYQNIAATCPKLMCVNLYVTGLLMFYAGQIAHKLIDDLNRTPDTEWAPKIKPKVRVTFAGKGSRLFQWLNTIDGNAAYEYYGGMFVKGYGESHLKKTLADWQTIVLPQPNDPNIKYEVSKGLAKGNTKLQRPTNQQASEIIGENGFELTGNDNVRRPIEFTNSISPDMLSSIGIRLSTNNTSVQAEKFTDFCGFFYSAAQQLFGWNVNPAVLEQACRNMNITGYVQNMPEFRAAQREAQSGNPFNFVAPIIILEGMKFYDETLLNLL